MAEGSSYKDKYDRAMSSLKTARKTGEKAIEGIITVAEGGVVGGVLGALTANNDGVMPKVMDVPVSGVITLGALAAGVMGGGRSEYDKHFFAAGAAAASVTSYEWVKKKWPEWRKDEKKDGVKGSATGAVNATLDSLNRLAAAIETGGMNGSSPVDNLPVSIPR